LDLCSRRINDNHIQKKEKKTRRKRKLKKITAIMKRSAKNQPTDL